MRSLEKRIERIERRKLPSVPVVVRWSAPAPGQRDIRTKELVALSATVKVVVALRTRNMWDCL